MSGRTSVGPDGRVSPADHVHTRQFDDELVILSLQGGDYFALNAMGARIWSRLISGESPSEAAAALAPNYDVALDQLLADCVELADELIERGLVRRRA